MHHSDVKRKEMFFLFFCSLVSFFNLSFFVLFSDWIDQRSRKLLLLFAFYFLRFLLFCLCKLYTCSDNHAYAHSVHVAAADAPITKSISSQGQTNWLLLFCEHQSGCRVLYAIDRHGKNKRWTIKYKNQMTRRDEMRKISFLGFLNAFLLRWTALHWFT